MADLASQLQRTGRRPFVIPMGGSTPIGARGYVVCADEIREQTQALGARLTDVAVASSSGGTQSGLAVGFAADPVRVHGISVDEPQDVLTELVRTISAPCAEALDRPAPREITVHTDWIGPGYALPSEEMVEAVRLFARFEGILLDPVYSGKGAAGFLALARAGAFEGHAVFVHTGGSPALFAYPRPAVPYPA